MKSLNFSFYYEDLKKYSNKDIKIDFKLNLENVDYVLIDF